MKKTLYTLLGSLLLFPVFISNAFALDLRDLREEVYRPDNLPAGDTGGNVAEIKLNYVINYFVELILYAAGGVAVLMLVIGGVVLIGSAGNEQGAERAKKIIKYALIGLFAVILAYALVTNVIDFIFRATT
jgi:hypothetical protein